jgi:hypothetical protein
MNALRSIRCLLSTVLVLTLLGSSVVVDVAAAQNEPVIGPSGTADAIIMMPAYKGTVTAPAETLGIEGGVDIPLPCSICHRLGGTNEPAIAVNPLNSANIAVASLFELRVSINNGMNFSAPVAAVVPATHRLAGDPSLAFDSQGRLFWTYLGSRIDTVQLDIFIAQVDPTTGAILPGYPVNVTAEAGFPASVAGNDNDKEWLAADRFPGSSFQDQLYVVWTRFTASGTVVHTTFSTDQGLNWSSALILSAAGEGFVWPSHNAVAPNGDVYVAYHSQPRFVNRNPDGTSGQVFVLRSTDGGATYPQKTIAYTPGNADITFNVQTGVRTLDGNI